MVAHLAAPIINPEQSLIFTQRILMQNVFTRTSARNQISIINNTRTDYLPQPLINREQSSFIPVIGTCSHLHFNNSVVISVPPIIRPWSRSVPIHCSNVRGYYQFSANLIPIVQCFHTAN